ncbi:MAG: chemotaxis protein CheC [Planctomycetaceae bacterium]|nr:chemotaxis protein CheC [Planctomycetaceae bacterium]
MTNDFPTPDSDVIDALTELVNIGVGRAAAALSELIGERIELSVPHVRLGVGDAELSAGAAGSDAPATVVTQDFRGRISGRAGLAFPQPSALKLGGLLTGGHLECTELDAELSGILLEVGNIVLNGLLGSFSNVTGDDLEYSLPALFDDQPAQARVMLATEAETEVLIADVEFGVRHSEISGTISIVFSGGCVRTLLSEVLQTA